MLSFNFSNVCICASNISMSQKKTAKNIAPFQDLIEEDNSVNVLYSLTNKPTDQPHIEAAEVIGGS